MGDPGDSRSGDRDAARCPAAGDSRNAVSRVARPELLAVLVVLSISASVFAIEPAPGQEEHAPARGFGYLGGFFVTNVDTTVGVFSNDVPLGARVSLTQDLGFGDSETVPRATLGWRFGERHLLLGGWYNLERGNRKTLDTAIPLPPGEEFPIGATVNSTFDVDLYKLQYTWLFHRDSKVSLGLGAGLFIAGITFEIEGEGTFNAQRFDTSVTAPLPVAGMRLSYHVTPRANVTATADWFFVKYGDSKGVLGDFLVIFDHRTFKHVGFAGGLNLWTQNVDFVDDDILLEVDQGFVGYLAAVTFYF